MSSSIVFADNPVRPFVDHVCSDTLVSFGTAAGSGSFSGETFKIEICTICGMGFTNPLPTEETAHLLYETRESNDFQPDDSSLTTRLKAIAVGRDVQSFCRRLDLPEGLVLDFGCGNAAFTVALQDAFQSRTVIGSDLQAEAPKALEPTRYRSYKDLDGMEGKFSFILCRHVLEHSYNPAKLLAKLNTLLVPGGVLTVEVPSLDAKAKVLFGKYWDNYYAPYHPIHFTRGALRAAFLDAHFAVIRESGAEMPRMGRSLQNYLGCKYNLGLFALGMLLQPVQIGIGLLTHTSASLRIWGRKAG